MSFFDEFDAFNPFGKLSFIQENELIDNSFNSYNSFSQEKEDDNIKNDCKIDITSKITQPTLNQNLTNEDINDNHDFNGNQNKIISENIIDCNYLNGNQNINMNLNENYTIKKKEFEFKTERKILGRKRKDSNEVGKHGKDSGDNIIRKIKSCLLNFLLIFINSFIYEKYNGNIGEGKYKKAILKINQQQIINDKNNKIFMKKTLKEIFSNKLSKKFSTFDSEHNKKLIEFLLNESDIEKRKEFQNLFSLTFLDCLNHFSGIKLLSNLKGMKSLNDLCKKFEDDQAYIKSIKYYTFNFEKIIMDKKSRNRTK